MFASVGGRTMYQWRAVNAEGEVLDLLVQQRLDKGGALKLMRHLLRKQGFGPTVIVTDNVQSYDAARREISMTGRHVTGDRLNNRAENSRQPTRRPGRPFQDFRMDLFIGGGSINVTYGNVLYSW
jgi:putative transposase